MCQISRRSEYAFVFYSNFSKCAKRRSIRRKKRRNKNEIFGTHISKMAMASNLVCGVGLPGGHICSKTGSNWMKDHGVTKV